MNLFGEYLVSKGLITEQQLLDCVLEQINSAPPLALILHRERLIDLPTLLQALKIQAKTKKNLKDVCVSLGVWSSEIEIRADKISDAGRTPLGTLLVTKDMLAVGQLTQLLQEYFSQIPAPLAANKGLDFSFQTLDPQLKSVLDRVWTTDARDKLVKLSQQGATATAVLAQEFQKLRGLFKVCRAPVSEELCRRAALRMADGAVPLTAGAARYFAEALKLLWQLREAIFADGTEENGYRKLSRELKAHFADANQFTQDRMAHAS